MGDLFYFSLIATFALYRGSKQRPGPVTRLVYGLVTLVVLLAFHVKWYGICLDMACIFYEESKFGAELSAPSRSTWAKAARVLSYTLIIATGAFALALYR